MVDKQMTNEDIDKKIEEINAEKIGFYHKITELRFEEMGLMKKLESRKQNIK